MITIDVDRNLFRDGSGKALFAEDLIRDEIQFSKDCPHYEVSQFYWEVSFEYCSVASSKETIDVNLILTNKQNLLTVRLPNELAVDYIIVDNLVVPLQTDDFATLGEFLTILDRAGDSGFTIKELIHFDYFAVTQDYVITNPLLKEEFLAGPRAHIGQFKSVLTMSPYPYQAVGIEWLRSQQALGRPGVILGDVMGLGKTLQAIGLLTHNLSEGPTDNLVVCPGTLLENWRREIAKFSPRLNVLVHIGANRAGTAARVRGYDVVITSYDVLARDRSMLSSINWNVVMIDEAQAIKNPKAKRTIAVKSLPRNFGMAITGTPLENRLLDLWSLSDFAQPGIFWNETNFENEYENGPNGATEVNTVIRPILLRRRLHEIEHQLPEKIVIDHPMQWPPELNELYDQVRADAIAEFRQAGGLVATGRLRKLTTHPSLMDIDISPPDLAHLSPKYSLTIDLLSELFANNEKCLIFASYREIIDLLTVDIHDRFPRSFVNSLDGRTAMVERSPLVDKFNSFQGSGVLICNPLVAGAGLNIIGANHVIHYNLEWNPAKEDQATFRVYRNGQQKRTFVHRLFYMDTIDEVIDERIQIKRKLSDLSVDAAPTNDDYLAALQATPTGKHYD